MGYFSLMQSHIWVIWGFSSIVFGFPCLPILLVDLRWLWWMKKKRLWWRFGCKINSLSYYKRQKHISREKLWAIRRATSAETVRSEGITAAMFFCHLSSPIQTPWWWAICTRANALNKIDVVPPVTINYRNFCRVFTSYLEMDSAFR